MMTDLTTQADADKWLARIVDTKQFIDDKKKEVVSEYKTDDPATLEINKKLDELLGDLLDEYPAPGEEYAQYAGVVRDIFNTHFDKDAPEQMFVGVPLAIFPMLVMRVMLVVYYFPFSGRSATTQWSKFAARYKEVINLDLNPREEATHGA